MFVLVVPEIAEDRPTPVDIRMARAAGSLLAVDSSANYFARLVFEPCKKFVHNLAYDHARGLFRLFRNGRTERDQIGYKVYVASRVERNSGSSMSDLRLSRSRASF